MEREEALVKIGSALTLVNDVKDNYEDEIGSVGGSVPKEHRPALRMARICSGILTDLVTQLQCDDETHYVMNMLNMFLNHHSEGGDEDDGNDDNIEVPF